MPSSTVFERARAGSLAYGLVTTRDVEQHGAEVVNEILK